MDLKKIEGNVEKPPIENIESIQNWLEDDVEVEKPDFVLVQESADEFIKSLENDESNSFYDTSEINPVMVPEIRDDVPGFEGRDVLVCGVPIETGEILNHEQGNNMYKAEGNCGLVSVSNTLVLCGHEGFSENLITTYAIENGECAYSQFMPPEDCGGTNPENIKSILDEFGVKAEIFKPNDAEGSIEAIAKSLEEGHVGVIGVNAGMLWDDIFSVGDGSANHAVTLTGTVRDEKTGKLLAITICDSGSNEPCHVVPIEEMRECYEYAPNATVILSKEPIRKI